MLRSGICLGAGETLTLQRLEDALEQAAHGGEPINEVGSEFVLARLSTRDKRRR